MACATVGTMLNMDFESCADLVDELWRLLVVVLCSRSDYVKLNGLRLLPDAGVGAVMLKMTPEGTLWSALMQAL